MTFTSLARLENRQRVEDRARRFVPGIPGNQHLFADVLVDSRIRHDHDRSPTLHCQAVRDIEPIRAWPPRVGLAGDNEIGYPSVGQDTLSDTERHSLTKDRPPAAVSNASFTAEFSLR